MFESRANRRQRKTNDGEACWRASQLLLPLTAVAGGAVDSCKKLCVFFENLAAAG
jgi:hypothetical protein